MLRFAEMYFLGQKDTQNWHLDTDFLQICYLVTAKCADMFGSCAERRTSQTGSGGTGHATGSNGAADYCSRYLAVLSVLHFTYLRFLLVNIHTSQCSKCFGDWLCFCYLSSFSACYNIEPFCRQSARAGGASHSNRHSTACFFAVNLQQTPA